VYLDAGIEAARRLIEARVIGAAVASLREQLTASRGMATSSPLCKELLQARKQGQTGNTHDGRDGPDHSSGFSFRCGSGAKLLAEGEGPHRKGRNRKRAQAIESCSGEGRGMTAPPDASAQTPARISPRERGAANLLFPGCVWPGDGGRSKIVPFPGFLEMTDRCWWC